MDELYQWYSQPEPDQELAYMYQQEELTGMHQAFPEPLPMQGDFYTSPTPAPLMAPNAFHPSLSRSFSFPSFGDSALPNLPFGAVMVNKEHGQPLSSLSDILSFGEQVRTLNFSGGACPPDGIEEGMQEAALEIRRSRAALNTQEHVIAERRRREKMQQQFMALATIVPDLTKTDKVSLLEGTIEYVKQLEEKVKTLEESSSKGTTELVFESKERRGVLVMVISEVEKHGLSVINTSVLPFTDSCLNITIAAKIGEGFSATVELVKNLTTALRGFA